MRKRNVQILFRLTEEEAEHLNELVRKSGRSKEAFTKAGWSDTSEIVCYHGFQSFKHGEVTPEQAHEVGVKLAERMWGDRFQVIVATHLNTDCLHNHFVVNSVSFADSTFITILFIGNEWR